MVNLEVRRQLSNAFRTLKETFLIQNSISRQKIKLRVESKVLPEYSISQFIFLLMRQLEDRIYENEGEN